MAIFKTHHTKISGLSVCVPSTAEDNFTLDLIPARDRDVFIETVGIRYRRVAQMGTTSSDLCCTAAERLMEHLRWDRADVDILVFITQTPDYLIPNSSSILQQRLGLSKGCLAFDINLGCSGYVYGLSVVASLLQNIKGGKALLLVGDCSTSVISKNDKSTWPLFSDAGSATAVENTESAPWSFHLQTDGSGYEDIMIKAGGMRHRFAAGSLAENNIGEGICRSDLQMKLDGARIVNFALREVAANIQKLLSENQIPLDAVDYFVFHQANKLMIDSITRKLKADPQKVPSTLYDYGNTSSASIPLTIAATLGDECRNRKLNLVLCGFGVGLSWGSVYLATENIEVLPVIEV